MKPMHIVLSFVAFFVMTNAEATSLYKEEGNIFVQPKVINIDDYVTSNPNVFQKEDQMIMAAYTLHLDPIDNYSSSISKWNLGNFTGLQAPSGSLNETQRGLSISNDFSGGTAFQTVGNTVAVVNAPHVYSNIMSRIKGDLIFPVHPIQVNVSRGKAQKPFQTADSYLNMEFEASMPIANGYGTNGIAYLGPNFTLHDTTTNTVLYIGTQIFDSRLKDNQLPSELVMVDSCDKCSGNLGVATILNPNSQYISPLPGSGSYRNSTWSNMQYFGWRIGYKQLEKILKNASSDSPNRKFSLNPADYEVVGFLLGTEVVLHNISEKYTMSTAVKNFRVFKSSLVNLEMKGFFEGVYTTKGVTHADGWACALGIESSMEVEFYAGGKADEGGTLIGSVMANSDSESGVANACGTTRTRHRFNYELPASALTKYQGKKIYGYVKAPSGYGNVSVLLNSGESTLPVTTTPVPTPVPVPAPAPTPTPTPAPSPVEVKLNGYFEGMSNTAGTISAGGWACALNIEAPVLVDFYAGGTPEAGGVLVGSVTANSNSESGVNSACGKGTMHRFSYTFSKDVLSKNAGKKIIAQTSSPSGYSASKLVLNATGILSFPGEQQKPIDISAKLKGNFEGIYTTNGVVHADGWACALGVVNSAKVEFYVGAADAGGVLVGSMDANFTSESGVGNACGTSVGKHRFNYALSSAILSKYSGKKLFTYVQAPVGYSAERLLMGSAVIP